MAKNRPRIAKRVPPVPPVSTARQPRVLPRTYTDEQRRLSWRFGMADLDGPWGWRDVDAATMQEIIGKLRDFESMTVSQLFHQGDEPGKQYALSQLPAKPIKRLRELDLDDADNIYRLRLGGKKRLYGFLFDDVFHLLWWDPDHGVFPSKLKHT
jgi:hypothetical protein